MVQHERICTMGLKYPIEEQWFDRSTRKIGPNSIFGVDFNFFVTHWTTCVTCNLVRLQSFNFEIFLMEADRKQVEDTLSSTSLETGSRR